MKMCTSCATIYITCMYIHLCLWAYTYAQRCKDACGTEICVHEWFASSVICVCMYKWITYVNNIKIIPTWTRAINANCFWVQLAKKSKMVHEGVLPCCFSQILQLWQRQNAETAWQNTLVDNLLDFGQGKLKRNLLYLHIHTFIRRTRTRKRCIQTYILQLVEQRTWGHCHMHAHTLIQYIQASTEQIWQNIAPEFTASDSELQHSFPCKETNTILSPLDKSESCTVCLRKSDGNLTAICRWWKWINCRVTVQFVGPRRSFSICMICMWVWVSVSFVYVTTWTGQTMIEQCWLYVAYRLAPVQEMKASFIICTEAKRKVNTGQS